MLLTRFATIHFLICMTLKENIKTQKQKTISYLLVIIYLLSRFLGPGNELNIFKGHF